MSQAIHFIAIGGSVMHNLALALQQRGYTITGSDDEIYEPSRTRLHQHNLLPDEIGWFPERIHAGLDAVVVGMHTRSDNPELIRAQELGLSILSYPEYIHQQSRQKQRIVITGSHGKTTITSIILHVLKQYNRTFDYLVGAPVDGFDTTVKLTTDAPIIIIEGDQYASSPVDRRPKFLHYQPHIALISGIAWDYANLYPTWDEYVDQFELLAEAMPKAGILIFDESDDMLDVIGQKERVDITKIPYKAHLSEIVDGQTYLVIKQNVKIPVQIFGEHNMKNITGAMTVLDRIGITEEQFYAVISSFKGVDRRLEKVAETPEPSKRIVFRDFAHTPSKIEAATEAVKRQYAGQKLLAVVELPMHNSLNKAFLEQYKGCLDAADEAAVCINAHALAVEQIQPLTPEEVTAAFERPDLRIYTEPADLKAYLDQHCSNAEIFLLMSSGNFGGLTTDLMADRLL